MVYTYLPEESNCTDKIQRIVLYDNESSMKNIKMDIFNLKEANLVKENILSIIVSYSGGCNEHKFILATVPRLTNTHLNPHVNLLLGHDNNGDTCKKIVRQSLEFDLSPLKERYQKVYDLKAGSMVLHITNTTITIKYDFK
jgi:hypothetical protein